MALLKGILVLSVLSLLAACGGSGSSGSGSTQNVTVTGTVSGTTVVAYDKNGNLVASNTASGSPKTFTLTLPMGSYSFYLVENGGTSGERVYPLYWESTNLFTFTVAGTINLGYVDMSSGIALPTNNPLLASGVFSGGQTSAPQALSSAFYNATNLEGTWNFHALQSNQNGWFYGQETIDGAGSTSITAKISNGTSSNSWEQPLTFISAGGIINSPLDANLHGVMSADRNTIIATDGGTNYFDLILAQKKGSATFSLSDLAGAWNEMGLVSGDSSSGYLPGWFYSTATIDSSGKFTPSTSAVDSSVGPYTFSPSSGTFSMTSDGVITFPGLPVYGQMSQDKNVFFTVGTLHPGCDQSNCVYGYNLGIFVRSSGSVNFSSTDLQGTWNMSLLTVGQGSNWLGWSYGTVNIDSNDNFLITHITRSNGDSTPSGSSFPLSISSSGIVTASANAFHGVMTPDKNMIFVTLNDGGGGYDLMILQK